MRIYERLLANEATKDVAIDMSDGALRAHSVILYASSEALQGQLSHGVAGGAAEKRLSWKEHSKDVGSFLLSLLYLNGEVEWDGDDEVPMRILLGALTIAKMNLIDDAIAVLTKAVRARLSEANFEETCVAAIQIDHIVLRLACIEFAKQSRPNIKADDRVLALRSITCQDANVAEGVKGTVEPGDDDGFLIVRWDGRGYKNTLRAVINKIELLDAYERNSIHSRYKRGDLLPEVASELAGLWATTSPGQAVAKRRRLRL